MMLSILLLACGLVGSESFKLRSQNTISFPTPVPQPLDVKLECGHNGLREGIQAVDNSAAILREFLMNGEENWVVSPLGLAVILGELHLGASSTFQRILADVLSLPGGVMPGLILHRQLGRLVRYLQHPRVTYQLETNGALFVQKDLPVKQSYKHALFDFYGTEMQAVDFRDSREATITRVNTWVRNATRGLISKLSSYSFSPPTALLLIHTLYFKSGWDVPFDPKQTQPGSFFVNKTLTVSTDFMSGNKEVLYYHDKSRQLVTVGLPYKASKFIMYFLLPLNTSQDIHEVASNLNTEAITELTWSTTHREVTLVVPKLKLNSEVNIGGILKRFLTDKSKQTVELSMRSASDDPRFKVDDILQQVVLEMDEAGTEAAVVTSTLTDHSGLPLIRLDRPFLFFIRHVKTEVDLFWGAVHNPADLA